MIKRNGAVTRKLMDKLQNNKTNNLEYNLSISNNYFLIKLFINIKFVRKLKYNIENKLK